MVGYLRGRHIREFAWIAVGQASGMAASLLTVKYLTNAVAPSIYGQYSLLLAAMALPTWVLFAPFSQPVLRYYSAFEREGRLTELMSVGLLSYAVVSFLLLVFFNIAAVARLSMATGIDILSLRLVSLVFFCEVWTSFGVTVASARRERLRVSMVSVIAMVSRPLLIFAAVRAWGPSLPAALAGYLASAVLAAGYAALSLTACVKSLAGLKISREVVNQLLSYGMPFGLWGAFHWAQLYVDRYALGMLMGTASAGYYVAAMQIVSFPFMIGASLISQFITPVVYQRVGGGRDSAKQLETARLLRGVCFCMFAAGLPLVAVYAVCGRAIMRLFTNAEYLVPLNALAALSMGVLFTVVAQQLSLVFLANNKTWHMLAIKVLPGLVGVPVMWGMVTAFGLPGAAFGSLIVASFYFALTGLAVRRINNMHSAAYFEPAQCGAVQ